MTKKTVQRKKNNNISLQKTKDIELSIQFSLDGFSFCITDAVSKKALYFSDYKFDKTLHTPEKLLEKVESIFKKDANLQLEFNTVLVIHQNNLSTLVPSKYFNKSNLSSYLNFNIKTLKTDLIAFDEIKNTTANNVYVPYVNINNYLFQNFGEFEYKHHLTVFIEKLLLLKASEEKKMYINVSKNNFDIVILKNGKIILSNSFSFENKEDFIYYILFIAEQLNLNTDKFPLYFIGEIEEDSVLYKVAYKYIRNISFLKSNKLIFNELSHSKHSNFILLG